MRPPTNVTIPALLALALLAPTPALAYQGGPVQGGGTISGTATFGGTAPAAQYHEIPASETFCGDKQVEKEELLVDKDGGLANVVVYIDRIEAGKPAAPGAATLDNASCRYEPHVVALLVGSALDVVNSDPILHNTHAKGPVGNSFNVALPNQGQVVPQKMRQPGLMQVGCDIHAWMSAWIAVFSHPYFAVTDRKGRYSLADVPPGEWTLVWWHEKLGRKTSTVKVDAAGVTADMAFSQ